MDAPRTKLAKLVIAAVGAKNILEAVSKADKGSGLFKIKVTSNGVRHAITAIVMSRRHNPKCHL
jgi:hypothetical protein